MVKKPAFRAEKLVLVLLMTTVLITIFYGNAMEQGGVAVRRWHWPSLILVMPVIPLLFLQQKAMLPPVEAIQSKGGWRSTVGVGVIFGLLDVLVMKVILHPQPYTSLPPFLQPFPYSIFLYTAGALEVELYYRMIPLTLALLLNEWLFKGRHRKIILMVLCVVTSLIEPILQMPNGAWWLLVYATLSGIAMNGWQFRSYLVYGFGGTIAVRLGHYFIWHILLGVYVQFFEMG